MSGFEARRCMRLLATLLALMGCWIVFGNWLHPSLAIRRAGWLVVLAAQVFYVFGSDRRVDQLANGILLAGAAPNAAVWLANDCMPVPPELWVGGSDWWCLMTAESRLPALADVWWGWSIGDFILILGMILRIVTLPR